MPVVIAVMVTDTVCVGKHERPAASNAPAAAGKAAALEASAGGAAGAMDSLGESSVHSRDMIMSAEEEARRANRFIKTSAAKKAAGNSSSGALGTVYDSGTSNDSGSDYAIVEHMRARQAATTAAAAATANNSNGKATAAPSAPAAAAASSNGKLIPSRPTPLQTLQAKNSGILMHNMLIAAAGGNSSPGGGSSSKAGSPLRSRKASGLDFDDTEALDELDDEQFNSMMDTLSQQPRLGRDRLENDEEVDEEVPPAFNQASLNLEGESLDRNNT